jgi:hypothetical protein
MAFITAPLNTTTPGGNQLGTNALQAFFDVTMTAGTGGKYHTIAVQVKGGTTATNNAFTDLFYTTGPIQITCAVPHYGWYRYRIVNSVSGAGALVDVSAPG